MRTPPDSHFDVFVPNPYAGNSLRVLLSSLSSYFDDCTFSTNSPLFSLHTYVIYYEIFNPIICKRSEYFIV